MCTGKYIECSKVTTTKPTRRMTKREQRVMALHNRLPELSAAQRRWMLSLFDDIGYYWKRGEVWCQRCGHIEHLDVPELAVSLDCCDYICPECGHRLLLKHFSQMHGSAKTGLNVGFLTTVVTTMGGQQVFRTYLSERCNVKGEPTRYDQHAIFENWIDEQGREVILSRQYSRSLWHMTWQYESEWSVKKHNGHCSGYYVTSDLFDISGHWFYPQWRMSKVVMRNGWRMDIAKAYDHSPYSTSPVLLVQNLLKYPECEMLMKNGQKMMFYHLVSKGVEEMAKYIPSIRICNRNKYIIEDAGIWCDYIDMLEYFGKDVRNVHYVCPSDLRKAHDRLLKKKIDREFREKLTKDIARSVKYEKAYREQKGRYFGICFGNENIVITVICSVKEMAMEGEMMHHCVFANAYYKKADSLILSARDSRGLRLETVEVSLRTWQVLQSRGVCNNPTKYHDEIIRLVNENMYQFKKVA